MLKTKMIEGPLVSLIRSVHDQALVPIVKTSRILFEYPSCI